MSESFTKKYLDESVELIRQARRRQHRGAWPRASPSVRDGGGRLFILGVGGSAGHAGHAVNDFRKICGFEAYAPTDNVSELTARVNDEGWDTCFSSGSRARACARATACSSSRVGGGNREKNVSVNLVRALELAREVGAKVFGIVGRDGGYTKQVADACVVVPDGLARRVNAAHRGLRAPSSGTCSSAIPKLQRSATKWESVEVTDAVRVAILDRDGTIIDVVRDEETGAISVAFHPDRSSACSPARSRACARCRTAGFVLAIATNQPAPAKGQFSADAVHRTNDALVARLRRSKASKIAARRSLHAPPGGRAGRRSRPSSASATAASPSPGC